MIVPKKATAVTRCNKTMQQTRASLSIAMPVHGAVELSPPDECAINGTTNAMTFEEIDACAKELFSKEGDLSMWPYIDEGDRGYWRKMAVEELKRRQQTTGVNARLSLTARTTYCPGAGPSVPVGPLSMTALNVSRVRMPPDCMASLALMARFRMTSGENQTLQSPRKGARTLADNGFRGSIC